MTTLLQNITLYAKNFLDLIFPSVCLICHSLSNDPVCAKCQSQLKLFESRKPFFDKGGKVAPFNHILCLFPYEEPLKQALHLLKFERKQILLLWLNKLLLNQLKENNIDLKGIALITSVPLAKKRLKERGFNQAELLARSIGDDWNIPYQETLLRTKETTPQFKLKKEARMKNLNQAFQIITLAPIKHKKILLVDDIYTTGATLRECGKVLTVAGAKQIIGLTLAKAI
jgi:ComF family protein